MSVGHTASAYEPDQRDLYLLIAGIVVGLLLGPHVLGALDRQRYDRWFTVGAAGAAELAKARAEGLEQALRMAGAGASETGVQELAARAIAMQREGLAALGDTHQRWLGSRWTALVLAVVAITLLETLLAPNAGALGVRARLGTARCALLAVWLALALAQPRLLHGVPGLFVAMLAVVAAGAALVPLGRRGRRSA